MTRLGIVTGLAAERTCIERAAATLAAGARPLISRPLISRPLIFCAGGSTERSLSGAERLLADGAHALLSFGIAGGLDPGLAPGALLLADAVLTPEGRRIPTDEAWRERWRRRAADRTITVATVAGERSAVATAGEKSVLFAATAAAAVDMESLGVGLAAERAGVPFLVVRAIADPAARTIPWSALSGLGADGRYRPLAVAGRLLLRPWETLPLIRVAADSRAALRALRGVAALDPLGFALV